MKILIFIILCKLIINCPLNWPTFNNKCFLFVKTPQLNYTLAEKVCKQLGAKLAIVKNNNEHLFISKYLLNNDPSLTSWLTGGLKIGNNIIWNDKTIFTNYEWISSNNINNINFNTLNNYTINSNYEKSTYLVYQYSFLEGNWKINYSDDSMIEKTWSYICQKNNLNEMVYSENQNQLDMFKLYPNLISLDIFSRTLNSESRGYSRVNFITQPQDVTYDIKSAERRVKFMCLATGYPQPQYTWFKNDVPIVTTFKNPQKIDFNMEGSKDDLTSYYSIGSFSFVENINDFKEKGYDRLSITNGILEIFDPHPETDQGVYHCSASNMFGTALSSKARLSFGYIKDFKPDSLPVIASLRSNAIIPCQAPESYPDVRFYWFKDYLPNFVPSEARIFNSWKGNLYFSNLELTDQGNYICMIKSTIDNTAANTLGKTSKPIQLQVTSTFINSQKKPTIEIGFPAIFPSTPLMGHDIRIECVAYGDPLPIYNWSRSDNGPIPSKARFEDNRRVLVIPNVKPTDVGNYICKAFNAIGESEQGVFLSISASPIFTTPLLDKFVSAGSTIQFLCDAFGIPNVRYRWYKNGKILDQNSLKHDAYAEPSSSSSERDSTNYRSPGSTRSIVETIFGFPKDHPKIEFVSDQSSYKKDANDIFSNHLETDFKMLVIRNVNERDDGIYQCEASNGHGTRFSTAQLKVLDFKPQFTSAMPDIVHIDKMLHSSGAVRHNEILGDAFKSEFVVVAEKGSLNLSCDAKALPSAKYEWFFTPFPHSRRWSMSKKYQQAPRNPYFEFSKYCITPVIESPDHLKPIYDDNFRIVRMDSQTNSGNFLNNKATLSTSFSEQIPSKLSINSFKYSDSGVYTCSATNKFGSVYQTTKIIVSRPGKIIQDLKSYSTNKYKPGSNITIECAASIEPGIDSAFKWLLNGHVVDLIRPYYKDLYDIHYSKDGSKSWLIIRNSRSEQSGEYICILASPISSYPSKAILIQIPGAPYGPSSVIVTDLTTTTAKLIWSNGGDNRAPVTHYIIQGRTKFRDWFTIKTVMSTGVKIMAPKVDFHAKSNGEINAMRYANREYIVQGLLPYNSYEFRISAVNEIGRGPFSPSSASYTMATDYPRVIPKNVRGGGGLIGDLVIRWDPLLGDEYGAPGLGYELFWLKKEDWIRSNRKSKFNRHFIHDANIDFYVAKVGQDNFYAPYVVKIRAINSVGPGPESDLITVMSAEDVPTKEPTLVQAFPYNSTALQVRWKGLRTTEDRDIIRGKLLGYKIQYGLIKENIDHSSYHDLISQGSMTAENEDLYQANDRQTRILYGAVNEGLVIGLIPNSRYWVKVMAFNSAGNGPVSDPVFMNTFKEAPLMQPTEITVTGPNSDGALRVAWNGIYTSNIEEPLEGYKIRIWEGREDISEYVDIPIGLLTYRDIYSFPEHRVYKIRILGYSRAGDGKMSQSIEICLKCNEIEKQDHIERLNQEYLAKLEEMALKRLKLKSSSPSLLTFISKLYIYLLSVSIFFYFKLF